MPLLRRRANLIPQGDWNHSRSLSLTVSLSIGIPPDGSVYRLLKHGDAMFSELCLAPLSVHILLVNGGIGMTAVWVQHNPERHHRHVLDCV